MLRLEMLPAEHGDALLLEYGAGAEATHRSLIDGGPGNAYAGVRQRLLAIPPAPDGARRLELLVVSHVDADHIDGVVKMVQDTDLALSVGDIWFNDWNHIAMLKKSAPPEHLGPGAGEFLGALLDDEEQPWNAAFGAAGVMVPDDEAQPLPHWTTPGGLSLTVVSPTVDTLIKLRANWKSAIEAAGFWPGDRAAALRQFKRMRLRPETLGDERRRGTLDHAEANGSSIALVAEFGGHRLLLGADAFADVLRAGVQRWVRERGGAGDGRMPLDAFKLPHHGSENNMTPQLMAVVDAGDYLISTNGKRFRHPNREAMDQVIAGHVRPELPRLRFNYLTPYTRPWERSDACRSFYGPAAALDLATD